MVAQIEIKTSKPITKLQRKVIDAIRDDQYNTVVVKSGRQVAKTTTAIMIAMEWCMNQGKRVGFFAPVYRQCRKVIDQMERALGKVDFITYNRTDMTVTFNNGAYIKFFSADGEIRGFTFDAIIVDEACFIPNEVYHAEIFATVGVAMSEGRGKQLLISTPKSRNWFYDKCMIEDPEKCVITATTIEGEIWTKEVVDKLQRETPDGIFRSEYLAEFVEDGMGIFEYKNCVLDEPTSNIEGCTAGLDFGMENDYTALAIMNNKGELVHLERWRKLDWMECLDAVVAQLKKFNVSRVFAETNGIGNMPAKMLQKKFSGTSFWVTSNKSKVDIINKLSADFKQDLIKIPRIPHLLVELDAYTMEYTQDTGKVTYGARSGFNDDCVMALAIANWNRITTGKRFTM